VIVEMLISFNVYSGRACHQSPTAGACLAARLPRRRQVSHSGAAVKRSGRFGD
jgi:hypothetical protein